jgi:hypothetical protein
MADRGQFRPMHQSTYAADYAAPVICRQIEMKVTSAG